ncbi:MAG: hypothetical protein M1820_010882 [Bogoriella megaspora]|nr:MAG: hypothetical protein M1820_010882 [Bogoriella megaspora]
MIEEKGLKKGFIVATLISTIVGTFASTHNLYERLKEKKEQQKRDQDQNDEIKKLKGEIKNLKKGGGRKDDSDSDSDSDEDDRRRRRRSKDALLEYFERAPRRLRNEYNYGFNRLGSQYAVGDVITENQLQAQVITLQQTVINVLQGALEDGRRLSRGDIERITQASHLVHDNSLDALQQQYQRMLPSTIKPRRLSLPPPRTRAIASALTRTSDKELVLAPRRDTVSLSSSLYCRYSLDLQQANQKRLSVSFAPENVGQCPECDIRVPVTGEDQWTIRKRKRTQVVSADGRHEEERLEERDYHILGRFVIKCHTEAGDYACLLCHRNRDKDILCPDAEALIAHVSRKHKVDEYEREIDIEEE